MNYCLYCHQPCSERDFCDETCKEEHRIDLQDWQQGDLMPDSTRRGRLGCGQSLKIG
jgi:hypothetical protein